MCVMQDIFYIIIESYKKDIDLSISNESRWYKQWSLFIVHSQHSKNLRHTKNSILYFDVNIE